MPWRWHAEHPPGEQTGMLLLVVALPLRTLDASHFHRIEAKEIGMAGIDRMDHRGEDKRDRGRAGKQPPGSCRCNKKGRQ
jgi:hypothetical protein